MLAARIAEKECNGSSTQEVIWINQCKCIASDRKQNKKNNFGKKNQNYEMEHTAY